MKQSRGLQEIAKKHLQKVNNWTKERVSNHINEAFYRFSSRSRFVYDLDLTWLEKIVPKKHIHSHWINAPNRFKGNKQDSILWAKNILSKDVLFLDTETTGLASRKNSEIIELGIVNSSGKIIYEQRFRPQFKIPVETIKIHGITNEDVKKSPRFSEKYQEIASILNGSLVVSYNAAFDQRLLNKTCFLHKTPYFDIKWNCAMTAYRSFSKSGRFLKLPGSNHSAVFDAKKTLSLVKKMSREVI